MGRSNNGLFLSDSLLLSLIILVRLKVFRSERLILLRILGRTAKVCKHRKKDNEYLTRSNFLESVGVDNFMKTRLGKMVVIRMGSRHRQQNQRKLKLGT